MFKTGIATGGAVLAAVILGAGLTGCSASVKTETSVTTTKSVNADDLQKDLTDRLTKAGMTAKSVTCKDDLIGEVGRTARCDVSFSDTNNVEAVFTATKVDGTTVDFDISPAMT
jgi:hypothetical protein